MAGAGGVPPDNLTKSLADQKAEVKRKPVYALNTKDLDREDDFP
jgi:hypothetical protein